MTGEILPISLVAHTVFCPRRAWLEAAGEQVSSTNIEAGNAAHERIDSSVGESSGQRRSVAVHHEGLGIVGKCDVVEESRNGLVITEFKSAPGRRSFVVTEAQRIQLALQGLCLAEAGHEVAGYAVHFTSSRRTVEVEVGLALQARAKSYVAETRRIVESSVAPPPLVDDPRCTRCSHAGVCLPDERGTGSLHRPARVLARDPDAEILHLTVPGARASLDKGRVRVVRGEEVLATLPLERVAGVVVHGNIDLSSGLVRELLWRRCTIVWASGRGSVVGFARSAKGPGGAQRISQHVRSFEGDIGLAAEMIRSKIANQATFLRRSSIENVDVVVRRLRRLQSKALEVSTTAELLGVEGEAASLYFQSLPTCVRAGREWATAGWPGRVGRGAADRLNLSLNLTYGLLAADITRAILATGLDPHAGFLHSSSRNKPALTLDLMEEFRPIIADSVVIGALNNGELRENMFTDVLGEWRLRDLGRRKLVEAYERRVSTEFRHPTFGYSVTWRRAMEVQARMLLGVIDGSQASYLGIRVR